MNSFAKSLTTWEPVSFPLWRLRGVRRLRSVEPRFGGFPVSDGVAVSSLVFGFPRLALQWLVRSRCLTWPARRWEGRCRSRMGRGAGSGTGPILVNWVISRHRSRIISGRHSDLSLLSADGRRDDKRRSGLRLLPIPAPVPAPGQDEPRGDTDSMGRPPQPELNPRRARAAAETGRRTHRQTGSRLPFPSPAWASIRVAHPCPQPPRTGTEETRSRFRC